VKELITLLIRLPKELAHVIDDIRMAWRAIVLDNIVIFDKVGSPLSVETTFVIHSPDQIIVETDAISPWTGKPYTPVIMRNIVNTMPLELEVVRATNREEIEPKTRPVVTVG